MIRSSDNISSDNDSLLTIENIPVCIYNNENTDNWTGEKRVQRTRETRERKRKGIQSSPIIRAPYKGAIRF
jgi:hypothetical protein